MANKLYGKTTKSVHELHRTFTKKNWHRVRILSSDDGAWVNIDDGLLFTFEHGATTSAHCEDDAELQILLLELLDKYRGRFKGIEVSKHDPINDRKQLTERDYGAFLLGGPAQSEPDVYCMNCQSPTKRYINHADVVGFHVQKSMIDDDLGVTRSCYDKDIALYMCHHCDITMYINECNLSKAQRHTPNVNS